MPGLDQRCSPRVDDWIRAVDRAAYRTNIGINPAIPRTFLCEIETGAYLEVLLPDRNSLTVPFGFTLADDMTGAQWKRMLRNAKRHPGHAIRPESLMGRFRERA